MSKNHEIFYDSKNYNGLLAGLLQLKFLYLCRFSESAVCKAAIFLFRNRKSFVGRRQEVYNVLLK
jgi:hypothetical protein